MTIAKSNQLDRIEAAIIGDGKEGLLGRTARIEEKLIAVAKSADIAQSKADEVARITAAVAEAVTEKTDRTISKTEDLLNALTISVVKLTASVEEHHKTEHFSDLLKKRSFYLTIFFGFIIMHFIATYVPNLWDGAMYLIGVPKLVIPLVP